MAETILEVLATTARTHATLPALARKRDGRWQALSWTQFQRGRGVRPHAGSSRSASSRAAAS